MARAIHPAAGSAHYKWNGGRSYDKDGYVILNGLGRSRPIQEHVYVAEMALGKPLPHGAQVHHFNEVKNDNRNVNLVICQGQAYHALLHELARVKAKGGRPFLDRVCWKCQTAKPKADFGTYSGRYKTACLNCQALMARLRRARMRDEDGKVTKTRIG